MSRSTGNLALDVLVRQTKSKLGVESAQDDATVAVAAAAARAPVARASSCPFFGGGPLAAHPTLDAGCSLSRSAWQTGSGSLHMAAADAADAGAGELAKEAIKEPITFEPVASDTPPGRIVHRSWGKSVSPPPPTLRPHSSVKPQLHASYAAPATKLPETCQPSLVGSLKLWVADQLSAMDDMQRAALARFQNQLDQHRAEFQAGQKELRKDLAEALTAQREAVEARLGAPLAGAFDGHGLSGDESGTGTVKPTAQFDTERWENHVRNTASALQAMQTSTKELARLAAGQGDIDAALRGALAKHATEIAAQRSELWDLGRELELCTRALQEREGHDQPAAEPSPSMDARHVDLEDRVSGLGNSVSGLEAKLSQGLEKASEEQAKARTALRTALGQHERDHEALREDLRRLERESREQLTQVGEKDAAVQEAVEQSIATRLATEIAPFEARHAALQASLDAVQASAQSMESSARRPSLGRSSRDDHQQAAVAVATAAASATDALKAQFCALQEDLSRLARELPREAELREGQARDTAARLDDLGKSVEVLKQRQSSADISRATVSADIVSQMEKSHTNFQDLGSQLDQDRLALEQMMADQVKVRKEVNEYGEKVQQEHDAMIDELREFGCRLTSFSVRGSDRNLSAGSKRPSQIAELDNFRDLVANQASDQLAARNELQDLSVQFQEEYAAVRKELTEFSNRLTSERRLSGRAVQPGGDKSSDFGNQLAQESLALESLAADHSVVRNELAELSNQMCKQQQDSASEKSASEKSQQILQSMETSLHHELCEFKQEQSTDRSKRERFLVDQLAAVEKQFHDELHELKGHVKQDATVPDPNRDTMQQMVHDEIQDLSVQLHRELGQQHVAIEEVQGLVRERSRNSAVPELIDGPSLQQLSELGIELREECRSACDEARAHGMRVKEDATHVNEELHGFRGDLANQDKNLKALGCDCLARLDMAEVELRELKSEVSKGIQDSFVQGGSGNEFTASNPESSSDGMGPLADPKMHMGISRNDFLLQMIENEQEERLKLKQSVDAERLARKEAAYQDEARREDVQVKMQNRLKEVMKVELSNGLDRAQAACMAHAEQTIERVTFNLSHLPAQARSCGGGRLSRVASGGDTSKAGETEKGEVEVGEVVNSAAVDEMEREIASVREAMVSNQGDVEEKMASVKDGLEEVTRKVCDLEGRVEAIEQNSEHGLKGDALEAFTTHLRKKLYDELYGAIAEELVDELSRLRSKCAGLGHDIHEAEQKLEDLEEKWEEAEGNTEQWLERQERTFRDIEAKLSKVEGAGTEKIEARRGALTLDADALMSLQQMPRKSLAAVSLLASRRGSVRTDFTASLESEARSSMVSRDSSMSDMTREMSER